MSTDGTTFLTDVGTAAIQAAIASTQLVAITHVAVGDGNGANYDPSAAATQLRSERARLPIVSQSQTDASVWTIRAVFPEGETPDFTLREAGYYDADSRLIAIWAGSDIIQRDTSGIDVIFEFTLVLTSVADGVVIVDAPPDDVLALAAASGFALGNQALEQLMQADRLTNLETTR